MPNVYQCNQAFLFAFDVAGVGGSTLNPDVSLVNRQWTMAYGSSGWWREAPKGLGWAAVLFYDIATKTQRLRFNDVGYVVATYVAHDFDCDGATTFTLTGTVRRGTGWPDTIMVAKV